MPTRLTLPLPPRFDLARTVCSYGFFRLAPNQWIPGRSAAEGRLCRLFSLGGRKPVQAIIHQDQRLLHIRCNRTLPRPRHASIKHQVARMLRLDEDTAAWRRSHPAAGRRRFERIFRSPTLFEDWVKTITSCNVTWPNTVRMNALLCAEVGRDGAFPTPEELAAMRPAILKARCKVGYRAERIIRLARDVVDGRLDPDWFEDPRRSTEALFDGLRAIYGFGDYAANNMLQLLGRYDRLPIDSETIRHFREVHGREGEPARIAAEAARFYDGFAPYQFKAYWFELWGEVEKRRGPAWKW